MQQRVGMPSPRYIRAIIFHNQTPNIVTACCTHRSGAQLTYNIPPGSHKIEKNDNNGSFTTIDAIASCDVQSGAQQSRISDDSNSIEVREYAITQTGITRTA